MEKLFALHRRVARSQKIGGGGGGGGTCLSVRANRKFSKENPYHFLSTR